MKQLIKVLFSRCAQPANVKRRQCKQHAAAGLSQRISGPPVWASGLHVRPRAPALGNTGLRTSRGRFVLVSPRITSKPPQNPFDPVSIDFDEFDRYSYFYLFIWIDIFVAIMSKNLSVFDCKLSFVLSNYFPSFSLSLAA